MMKLSIASLLLYLSTLAVAAPHEASNVNALSIRHPLSPEDVVYTELEKRRGGGGGKGGGGSSSGGGGSSSGGGGRSSPASNSGGRTGAGSGTPPAYGNRYTGGAQVPYTAGGKSPTRGISPALYPVGAFAFFPFLWVYPVFAYPYGYGYHYYDNGRNRTSNVTCLCEQYSECGCDPQDNSTLIAQQLTDGKGDGAPVNTSTVRTVNWPNGTTISYINGTLANGTTAAGGAASLMSTNFGGYWLMIATVIAGVTLL